jgi:spermidine synthase
MRPPWTRSGRIGFGLGTGTYSKQLKKYFKNAKSDAVEIDEKIATLASQYFNLTEEEATVYNQ